MRCSFQAGGLSLVMRKRDRGMKQVFLGARAGHQSVTGWPCSLGVARHCFENKS